MEKLQVIFDCHVPNPFIQADSLLSSCQKSLLQETNSKITAAIGNKEPKIAIFLKIQQDCFWAI